MTTQEAVAYLCSLMKVEEYENFNYTNEVDLDRLFKAKQFFIGQMTFIGQEKTKAQGREKTTEALYEYALALETTKLRKDLKNNGQKALTETDAKNAAKCDEECVRLKNDYIAAYEKKESLVTEYNILKTQVDAISQYIAYLRDEKQRDNFVKSNPQ